MKKVFFAAVCMLMSVGAMAQGTVQLTVDEFSIAPGGKATMNVNLSNPDNKFAAFQFDLTLPEGLDIVYDDEEEEYVADLPRKSDHSMSIKKNNGVYTLIAFSLNNKNFKETEGALVTLSIVAAADAATGATTGKITNAKFTPKSGDSVTFDEVPFNVTVGDGTGISSINADEQGSAMFNLNGQRVTKAQKGIVVKNGKKVIVK